MKEQLLERGKQLFSSNINAKIEETTDSIKIELLRFLLDQYQDKVTPMTTEDTFAAKRMATACIQACENCNYAPGFYDSILQQTQEIYEKIPIGGEIKSRKDEVVSEDTKRIDKELNAISDKLKSKMVADLVWDVPVEELDVEGARVGGYLPADFDSTECNPEDFIIEESEGNLVANVFHNESGEIVLTCPMCNSGDLVLETVSGCCMVCDCEFDIPLNLSDAMDENSTAEYSKYTDLSHRDGGVKRVDGDKKNRGIIIIGEDHSESE